jgi:hypothetical protein
MLAKADVPRHAISGRTSLPAKESRRQLQYSTTPNTLLGIRSFCCSQETFVT